MHQIQEKIGYLKNQEKYICPFEISRATYLNQRSQHDELEPNCKKNLHRFGIWGLVANVM